MLNVRADIREVTKGLRDLGTKAVPVATVQALNRAGATVKTETVRDLQKELALKNQRKLRQAVRLSKAGRARQQAEIIVADRWFGIEDSKEAKIRVSRRSGRAKFSISFRGRPVEQGFRILNSRVSELPVWKPAPGKWRTTGNRQFQRIFNYTAIQTYGHAKVDLGQEKIGAFRFKIEFDRALEIQLRRLRMKG